MKNNIPNNGESLLHKFPRLCEEWSNKNSFGPETYKANSGVLIWWHCQKCNHVWKTSPNKRTSGTGCPECAKIQRAITRSTAKENNSIEDIYPEFKKEFSPKNNREFKSYTPHSGKSVLWICNKCSHEWYSIIANRTKHKNGCPKCRFSKGEKNIEEYLIKNNIKFQPQYRIKTCKDKQPLPFDFAIWINNELKLIEYNGIQHYVQIGKYADEFQDRIKKDKIKYNYCKQNNIPLLTISYAEYNNIEQILTSFIGE